MNGFREVTCPYCLGSGIMREYDLHQYTTCPLCCGKGAIKVLVEEADMRHPPPTSAQLLARVIPLSTRTSGNLLVNRYRRYQPQPILIYSDRAGRGRGGHGPKVA